MKWWPFGKDKASEELVVDEEPSTMERLLGRNCTAHEFVLLMVKLFQEAVPDAALEMRNDFEVTVKRPGADDSTWFLWQGQGE